MVKSTDELNDGSQVAGSLEPWDRGSRTDIQSAELAAQNLSSNFMMPVS